jgi:hypothetical protein
LKQKTKEKAMFDLFSGFDATLALAATAPTSTATSAYIDLFGYEGAVVEINAGACTDGTHTFTLTESDLSGSGFSSVAAGDILGTLPAIASGGTGANAPSAAHLVGYKGAKRYIKVVKTVTGTPSTGCHISATVIKSRARHNPVA